MTATLLDALALLASFDHRLLDIVGLPAGRLAESQRFLEEHGLMTEVLGYVG